DSLGKYYIVGMAPGRVTVRASFVGYKVHTQQATITAGTTTKLDFTLAVAPQNLGDIVTTTAPKNDLVPRDQVTSRTVLDGSTVDRLPINRLSQAFAFAPGTVATTCSSAAASCSPS